MQETIALLLMHFACHLAVSMGAALCDPPEYLYSRSFTRSWALALRFL